jgi:hypothetical protein
MKTRCPNCGATLSLDALIAHDDARAALRLLVQLGGDLAALTLRYLGLFRPAQTELTFARVAKLLGELLPDIQAQRIARKGVVYDAPPAAWLWALQEVIASRDSGKLTLPLKSHGYLYEVISNYRPAAVSVVTPAAPADAAPAASSKTGAAVSALAEMLRK